MMIIRRILVWPAGLVWLASCSLGAPDIQTLCLRDDIGNYIIKWETNPPLQGTMKLYVSDVPGAFNKSRPVGYSPVGEGITKYVTGDNITRKYFLLCFNDQYVETAASRLVAMDSVQNFRDLGGYVSARSKKEISWGKVFRSGRIGALSPRDSVKLTNLKIKTIIDLRSEEEQAAEPVGYTKAKIIHIPVSTGKLPEILARISKERIRKGDGVVFMQDLYIQYVEENKEQFARALAVFEDTSNYPIAFSCSLGKDPAGFLTALLLAALDIPEEVILNDYLATNDFLDLTRFNARVQRLNSDAQETLTVILTANAMYLDLAFRKIKKDYGSIKEYLINELHLSESRQNKLKEMLLSKIDLK
ncbi:MAG: tyrosine-protein phosphatase [Tannerellaceae bacterium]|jgi:protein-tyrosine phosphatase|nr:tyrosine-protein phosphatase [Tannerellaceae bacterium]